MTQEQLQAIVTAVEAATGGQGAALYAATSTISLGHARGLVRDLEALGAMVTRTVYEGRLRNVTEAREGYVIEAARLRVGSVEFHAQCSRPATAEEAARLDAPGAREGLPGARTASLYTTDTKETK